jgi:hypothetical protein
MHASMLFVYVLIGVVVYVYIYARVRLASYSTVISRLRGFRYSLIHPAGVLPI